MQSVQIDQDGQEWRGRAGTVPVWGLSQAFAM